MLVVVSSDSDSRTGVTEAKYSFSEDIETFFKPRSYGPGLSGVGVVLMCRDPSYEFKQRVRLSKAENILDLDVMLDWNEMIHAGSRRKAAILGVLRKTVRDVFERRTWKDFDVTQFLLDFDTICERLARA